MTNGTAALLESFADPPPGYGPVPFWWWVGGTLDTARLCWQLDQLREKGVFAAVVSYNHHADGTTNVGDPAIFSDDWWTIFLAVLDHARAHGMTLGIQDYSLLKPRLKAVGEADPDMRGAELRHVAGVASPDDPGVLAWPADAMLVEATAWADGRTIDLADHVAGNTLRWTPEAGVWQVAVVYAVRTPFDPLHPEAGARSLAAFQQMIADRIGDHLGTTLTMFFQDELDFGQRWPFWSAGLGEAFAAAKGYPLAGRLAELWCDRGPATTTLRLDFADVAVGLLEAHYFAPVHRWHEAHGCLFGHDNAGRGAIAVGRDYYGDYMRTMRWYSAPGSDDPDLRGERAFKGLKVASSIAHLYDRPRVWAECFHSSGWGATPAEMLDGVNGVFALGATLINLHGLYYTTAGSWWEWAPPDFHFRQPYWAGMAGFNGYATRLSWLLSQGTRLCDVAILYPSTALAGGLNGAVDPALAGPVPLSEAQRFEPQPPVDAAEARAFAAARTLFDAGIDVDFVDDASLAGGAGEWRTILMPDMTTIAWDSLCALRDFAAAGGRLVALGALPRATDRHGTDDPAVAAIVDALFGPGGPGIHLPYADAAFAEIVAPQAGRSFRCTTPVHALHRRIGTCDIWFVRNPKPEACETELVLHGTGAALRLDAFTGAADTLGSTPEGDTHSRVRLSLPASGAMVVLLDPDGVATPLEPTGPEREMLRLDGGWHYALIPTMDNRFGDFAADDALVGADVRRMDWCEGADRPDAAGDWRETAPGHAPQLLLLGPVAPGDDLPAWEAAVASVPPGVAPPALARDGAVQKWRDYAFSTRDGILDDPFLKHWASGPHGLKDVVPDHYIDLEGGAPGDLWYLTTTMRITGGATATLVAGSRAAYRLWIGRDAILDQPAALPPGRLPEWHLPHYDAPEQAATIAADPAGRRVLLRMTQAADQRTRAYVGLADTPAPDQRRLRWFADGRLTVDPRIGQHILPQWFRFAVPPGATTLALDHRGTIAAWRDGERMTVESTAGSEGVVHSRLHAAAERATPGHVLLRIDAADRAGDCLGGPIRLVDPHGPIALGDWARQGLAGYSGGLRYHRDFRLDRDAVGRALVLDTGPIRAAAEILLNGGSLGHVIAPPWRIAIEGARAGLNHLEIRVFNTLANHYDQATPTPYVFEGQTVSGLLGVPRIIATD